MHTIFVADKNVENQCAKGNRVYLSIVQARVKTVLRACI